MVKKKEEKEMEVWGEGQALRGPAFAGEKKEYEGAGVWSIGSEAKKRVITSYVIGMREGKEN